MSGFAVNPLLGCSLLKLLRWNHLPSAVVHDDALARTTAGISMSTLAFAGSATFGHHRRLLILKK
jgi:hypothetical protein